MRKAQFALLLSLVTIIGGAAQQQAPSPGFADDVLGSWDITVQGPDGPYQTYDIALAGRRVDVVLNGRTIIRDSEIPGITGGALDSDEGAPGPLMPQGDHGKSRSARSC